MWIVRLGLRRPYTFVVMAVFIVILGGAAILTMPRDIFPHINIPVVSVVWLYGGMSPDEIEGRIVTLCERELTTDVNGIEHMDSQSYRGVAVIRIFFQPHIKVAQALASVTASVHTILRRLPPGILPPAVIDYDASAVPILQLSVNSKTLGEAELFDYGQNFIRTQLATVQGASIPSPFGGKLRQVMVDVDSASLYAKGLSPTDVSNALNAQNLIVPAGTMKVSTRDYLVRLNSSPDVVSALNDLPIKTVRGATVYMKDIGQVRDGFAVQTNIVRENGRRGSLITVLKNGEASTLDIVRAVQVALPRILSGLPPALNVTQLFDQSVFVRAAIGDVLREAGIAVTLTGTMILLFLGSWRSTLIVWISIPLSILTSLAMLKLFNETINVMTLGGLALAVGILVDDATVQIENLHRNVGLGKPMIRALLDSAEQIAVPAFVSTLAICIVFVPVLLLTGVARYLFTPLALAVVFAMLMSYVLTRTLVITMAHQLLKLDLEQREEVELYHPDREEGRARRVAGPIWGVHHAFNRWFERLRGGYGAALAGALEHRAASVLAFAVFFGASLAMAPMLGEDFFPAVDSGQMRLHVRAPQGTRIEETEHVFGEVEAEIRRQIPVDELETILDNIGLPAGGATSLALSDGSTIGTGDGEILVALRHDKHGPTAEYIHRLRAALREKFREETFFFMPANMTNQILNFGIPAAIDVQVIGPTANNAANYALAQEIERGMARIPGASDVHIHQQVEYPELRVNVDRTKASEVGLTQRDVASSLLISLAGSFQFAPNQWLNRRNGVTYFVSVQTPEHRLDSVEALTQVPIAAPDHGRGGTQFLGNVATVERGESAAVVSHFNVQPVMDVLANADGRDLGGVVRDVRRVMQAAAPRLARGSFLQLRGQATTMEESFVRLGIGIVFAIVLVYLLMAVNFQSWLDPFIILMALPGALSGIVWMLFLTQTTLSVPSLMGAMMTIGVATANSILVVTFANDERMAGRGGLEAAQAAGVTRFRPVLMTAGAMIVGMLPMSFGLGEGGEQNAPLARAVIGGLLVATVTTLFFVPIVYSYLRRTPPIDYDRRVAAEEEEAERRMRQAGADTRTPASD
jgi:multidrug efflux pump subunit AcrB